MSNVVEYRVVNRDGCTLLYGDVPALQLCALMKAADEESDERAIIATDLARMAGANFAWGSPESIKALSAALADGALRNSQAAHPDADPALVKWLAIGERGASSDAIVNHLTGLLGGDDYDDRFAHPWDTADFRRCQLLLDQVPALVGPFRERMHTLSPVWSRLAANWDDICASLDHEIPGWREGRAGKAPNTSDLIKETINE